MSRATLTRGSRSYAATTSGGEHLDVVVFDRDQEAAGALYRLYRLVRLRSQVSRGMPLSMEHAVERSALLSYAMANASVATPRLRAAIRAGPDAIVLAYEHCAGTTLADSSAQPGDAQLSRVWDAVLRMHAHGITHRALTTDRILITGGGDVVLLDPGNGNVAASDLQRRLDLAQLLAELALLVGPDKAVDSALAELIRCAGLVRRAGVNLPSQSCHFTSRSQSAFGAPWIRMTILSCRSSWPLVCSHGCEHANQRISMRIRSALNSAEGGGMGLM